MSFNRVLLAAGILFTVAITSLILYGGSRMERSSSWHRVTVTKHPKAQGKRLTMSVESVSKEQRGEEPRNANAQNQGDLNEKKHLEPHSKFTDSVKSNMKAKNDKTSEQGTNEDDQFASDYRNSRNKLFKKKADKNSKMNIGIKESKSISNPSSFQNKLKNIRNSLLKDAISHKNSNKETSDINSSINERPKAPKTAMKAGQTASTYGRKVSQAIAPKNKASKKLNSKIHLQQQLQNKGDNKSKALDVKTAQHPLAKAGNKVLSSTNGQGRQPAIQTSSTRAKSTSSQTNKSSKRENIDDVVLNLTNILTKKLKETSYSKNIRASSCQDNYYLANSCDKTCLRLELPVDVKTRVEQIVKPKELQLSQEHRETLEFMSSQVSGHYDVVLLTAASSNHYLESQALLKSLHERVFPYLKNFTLIFYNLGLSEGERRAMVKYCRCQVLDFPFERFPSFMRDLHCYSWKPVLIKAHLRNGNVLAWMDASIRYSSSPAYLNSLIERTRSRGIQEGGSSVPSPYRTLNSMYHYFGDEPCAYAFMGQAKATFGMFKNEYFVDRAVLEPWVACSVQQRCMCPPNRPRNCARQKQMTRDTNNGGPLIYGLCHRYDQSAISIILHKLYREKYPWVMVDIKKFISIWRKHTTYYFPHQLL